MTFAQANIATTGARPEAFCCKDNDLEEQGDAAEYKGRCIVLRETKRDLRPQNDEA